MSEYMKCLQVADFTKDNQVTFAEHLHCGAALRLLTEHHQPGAAVLNGSQQVIGFISQQDLLRALWSQEFDLTADIPVTAFMQTRVYTLAAGQSLLTALEAMIIDREILYPVNDTGYFLGGEALGFNQRLARAVSKVPKACPVVSDGLYTGMLYRDDIAQWLVNYHQAKSDPSCAESRLTPA